MHTRVFSLRSAVAVAVVVGAFLSAPRLPAQGQAPNEVEKRIGDAVRAPGSGLQVVHFWAPWCPNCQAEMKNGGWTDFIGKNPNTHFTFVSVWNKGEDGRATLEKFGVGSQSNVTVVADPNPSRDKDTKTSAFLGLPLGWIPTTWVFKNGKLYYALNYGEVRFPMLQQMLEDSSADWSHK